MLATPHWSTWLSEERRFLGFKERVLLFSLKGSFYSCQFLGYSHKQFSDHLFQHDPKTFRPKKGNVKNSLVNLNIGSFRLSLQMPIQHVGWHR